MQRHHLRYHGKGVQFVGVHSAAMSPAKLAAVVRNLGLTFPIAQDTRSKQGAWTTFDAYGAKQYPSIFIIDGDGFVSVPVRDPTEAMHTVEEILERTGE